MLKLLLTRAHLPLYLLWTYSIDSSGIHISLFMIAYLATYNCYRVDTLYSLVKPFCGCH